MSGQKVAVKERCPEKTYVRKWKVSEKERCPEKKGAWKRKESRLSVCLCVSVFSRERHNVQMLRASLSEKPGHILLLTIIILL